MAQVDVGTVPVRLPVQGTTRPMIQNLGPGIVYMDRDEDVDATTGIKLEVGDVYEFPTDVSAGGSSVYLISDTADTDVRYMVAG
jgi:hypothetical protein